MESDEITQFDGAFKIENHNEIKIISLTWVAVQDINEIPHKPGVYQIYGDSGIYGLNKLLYIGQAKNLKNRPKGHEDEKRINNFSIRYALCPENDLNFVEGLLIVTHKPSYNNKSIESPDSIKTKELTFIFNEGERGNLSLEISNYWWCWD